MHYHCISWTALDRIGSTQVRLDWQALSGVEFVSSIHSYILSSFFLPFPSLSSSLLISLLSPLLSFLLWSSLSLYSLQFSPHLFSIHFSLHVFSPLILSLPRAVEQTRFTSISRLIFEWWASTSDWPAQPDPADLVTGMIISMIMSWPSRGERAHTLE